MRRAGPEAGFSLVELIAVIAIIGLILGFSAMNLENVSPKYALRAGAREIGGTIDLARGTAAGQGTTTALEYDLDNQTYTTYMKPPQEEGPGDGPWGLVALGAPDRLPRGVKFRGIYAHEKGRQMQQSGVLRVRFDPLSIEGSHIVYLENEKGMVFSIKYNALLGSCDYVQGEAQFEAPPQ